MGQAPPNDGGPAFPSPTGNPVQHGQLSVRDYFAAQALAGFIAHGAFAQAFREYGYDGAPAEVAEACYRIADAMLKER